MKTRKWKSFLCICTSCLLVFGSVAYGDTVTITPLDQSQAVSLGSGGSGQVSTSGPGSEGSSGPAASGGNSSVAGSDASGASPSPSGGTETGEAGVSPSGGTGAGEAGGGPSGGAGTNASGVSPSGGTGTNASGSGPSGGNGTGGPTNLQGAEQGSAGGGMAGNGSASMVLDGTKAASVQKPAVSSEGAVLMEASSGTVLFEKNGDKQFYPASITKLMTALLVAESRSLDDKVTFTAGATTNLEAGAVSINMTAGDVMTVRQCLYALLLKSANEVGNALAEHVAGSVDNFAGMMNAKAAALGCANTHFTNPHGLNDQNHYTTPRDMALIARAAFQNDVVKTVASTRTYTLPATIKNPSGLTVTMGHKMLNPGDSRYYEGIIGGKTGYTSKAGNTLVTVAERDGVRLIAVIMKSKSTHYTDTKALFDYGYELVKAGALTPGANVSNAGGKTAGSSQAGPGSAAGKGWIQDGNGWYYIKDNGAKAASEWLVLEGQSYWFDSNTYMAKGWRQIGGKWYYLRSNGAMAKSQWEKVDENGTWFYLGTDGAMLTDTTTPDGYRVDQSGAWVQ